jgi:hypothetical protein
MIEAIKAPLNTSLEDIIRRARVLKWCVDYGCTTCGAHKFRAALKVFSRDQLVEELKTLKEQFLNDISNRCALLLIMHEVVFLENFTGLSFELAGSKAGEFLDRAIRIEYERRLNTKIRVEKEQIAKKMKDQINAQKNIWGAIKRKDFKAISQLLSYNLDLDEIGSLGVSLGDALKKIQN